MQLQRDELIRTLLSGWQDSALLLDLDGHVLELNQAALQQLNCDRASVVGRKLWELVWGESFTELHDWQQRACQLAAAGENVRRTFQTEPRNGLSSSRHFSLRPLANDDASPPYLLARVGQPVVVPVDDPGLSQLWYPAPLDAGAPRAEPPQPAALVEGELSFRLMVESIEDYAMFMVDLGGHINSWNRGAERLTGYSEVEAVGRHFSILYPREVLDEKHADYELAQARAHGRYEEEGVRVRKDGLQYQAQVIIWRIDDSAGNTVGFAKITRDVTTLRHAQQREAQLLESETRFRLMVESIEDYAMFMVDPRGLITSWNRGAERLTGYAETEALGQHFSMLYPRENLDETHAAFELAMARRYGRHEEEGQRVRKDGSTYHAQIIIWPVEDRRGDVIGFAKITRDVTLRRQAEHAMQEASRRKDEFLAMLAHELRNPLAPVRNSTFLIRKLASDDNRVVHGLDVIERQTQHMTRLIDDLLDVARISRGKMELRKEVVELSDVVRQTVDDFRADFDAKNVAVELALPEHPMHVLVDPTRIAQAIGNLLHNASKFTEPGDRVAIELAPQVTADGPEAVITVTDTGIGIEPALADQLFTPFTQATQDLARSHGGLGLGLALIKGLVELHGGTVVAASEGLGLGAQFTIHLPLDSAELERSAPRQYAADVEPLTIVLIDDNRDMTETLSMLLTMEGHHAVAAYDGESGLSLIRARRPHLVLCDIGLPGGKDGYAVAQQVRSEPAISKTYLVALSGYGQEQDRQQALASGFNRHLLKPLDFEELRQVLVTAQTLAGSGET